MNTKVTAEVPYVPVFNNNQIEGAALCAQIVVPLLLNLCPNTHSVAEVGYGAGVWLAQFRDCGINHILGIDTSSRHLSQLPESESSDLFSFNPKDNFNTDERFDLCLSFEVAQHVPTQSAPTFVHNLCKLSDIIVFSAAIPGQGGTHHINEQWPTYWAALFKKYNYSPLDIIRYRIWNDSRIDWWYRQNIIIYANATGLQRINGSIPSAARSHLMAPLDVVHPECFQVYRSELEAVKAIRGTNNAAPSTMIRDQLHDLTCQLFAMRQSTSWKITAPLRRLATSNQKIQKLTHKLLRR